ncbi:hypothetical protein SCHPADRAFT_899252 [Schizopora paradoxa]|uniref:Sds3-like-domain-containing protein n=1 Tax=Schizopora paradoxa TaxID=27342 RepID=A0A0H2SB23_9AGAM|nr:hypothetical protein SCHPADRAFT_899252 [Schizopora paradoxa]
MDGSRASSEVLTSPSPSPPPPTNLKSVPTAAKLKAASLDDTSSLSELTDDEGDGSRGASTHSSTPEEANGSSRRKRGSLVPAPMWGWAYKTAGRKPTDNAKDASRQGSSTPPPPSSSKLPESNGVDDDDEDKHVAAKEPEHPSGMDDADKGGDSDASTEGGPDADDQDDLEEEEEEEEEEEPEEEQVDSDDEEPVALADAPSKSDEKTREASPDLTDVEDEDEVMSERESESESEVESEGEEDAEPAAAEDPVDEPLHKVTVDSAAPVVPAAPASSSIMAGQQLIKTPTPSPSTSPEPEERPANPDPQELEPEATTALERKPEADPEVDNAENVEPAEIDADVEQEVEIEPEEAESDVQPAHRAEALDVLAGIELKFALLREMLYVEKMEDLAMEEAMILQGIHPEMIQLQAELQVRHDRRLELASRKRKHEDDHVRMMRKYDEDAIWDWWRHGRDKLQSDMFAEANRKRRKLEREKRVLERPPQARRIPPPPPFLTDVPPLTIKELVRYSTTGLQQHNSRQRRKQTLRSVKPRSYPTLNVLSLTEVQSDLQQLPIRRQNMAFGPQFGIDIGPGMGVPGPSAVEPFPDNALGIINGQQAFGQGPPQFAPPPSTQPRPYQPPVNRSIPPPSHHQQIGVPPPIGGLHHGGSRPMQGPGQPHVYSGSGGPPPMPAFNNPRSSRRSPSPPYEANVNGINGSVPQHGGMSGPGQRGWPKANGWKEQRRVPSGSGSKDAHPFDLRDIRPERETRPEKRTRDLRDEWYDNGVSREGDEHLRLNGPSSSHHQSGLPTHRHTLQHHNLHGIPHHHHVVHRHPGSHHHHDLSRSGASGRRHEHASGDYDHRSRRLPPDADHHANARSNASPLWKPEDGEPSRERGRPAMVGPSSSMGPQPPPPPSDRLQPTPFVMTPSQAMQAYPPSRRDHWDDRGPPPYADGHTPHMQEPGPSRHGHIPLGRPPSPPRHGLHNGLASPPRRIAPPGSPPFQMNSPRHHPQSSHPSPRIGASSMKSTRPISPVPAKILTSALYPPGPTGPGTPGIGGGSSRIGTPGLAGPGTRPDGPPHPNGHGSLSLFPSPAPPPPLTGPGGQSHLPPGNSDLLPSKMSVVPLGNGP